MQQSLVENDTTVVSIFVNPTSLITLIYQNTLEADIAKKINGLSTDIIYMPPLYDIYDGKVLSQASILTRKSNGRKIQTRSL
jgi:pantoate--beta-alanine ligase